MGQLLATIRPATGHDGRPAAFDPEYVRDPLLGTALAGDVQGTVSEPLLGAATHTSHWAKATDVASLVPGPPETIELLHEPRQECLGEIDLNVASRLVGYRITIVGGLDHAPTRDALSRAFSFDADQIRWIEAERDSEPNLSRLEGVRPDKDVVVCVTGLMGHAGSLKAGKIASARGVVGIKVEKRSEIITKLRDLFGRA